MNRLPGLSEHKVDQEAILLRAYGKGTDVLIDRDCKGFSMAFFHCADDWIVYTSNRY